MLYFILFGLVLVGAFAIYLKAGTGPTHASAKEFQVRYVRRELMTPTELKFFLRLVAAAPNLIVAPQVAMSALVDIAEHQKRGQYQHVNRAKISKQRLDYVLLSKSTGKVVCVVELDDHTHDNERQRTKDRERDDILATTQYLVLRFDARSLPSVAELQQQLPIA